MNDSGYMVGVGLVSFVQLLEQESKSCTLSVSSNNDSGTLVFREGQLIDAQSDLLEGLEAAYEILSWSSVDLRMVERGNHDVVQRIDNPLGYLIISAAHRRDERVSDEENSAKRSHQNMDPASMEDYKTATKLSEALKGISDVKHYYLLDKKGKVVSESVANKGLVEFITYCIMTGIKVHKAIKDKSLHFILVDLEGDYSLMIVPAGKITACLLLQDHSSAREIAKKVRSAVTEIKASESQS